MSIRKYYHLKLTIDIYCFSQKAVKLSRGKYNEELVFNFTLPAIEILFLRCTKKYN